eukprot:5253810-Pleurochrysis_carterae.AAC.1
MRASNGAEKLRATRVREHTHSLMICGCKPVVREHHTPRCELAALFTTDTRSKQMKTWVAKKNEHKAKVQRRWDNREKVYNTFQTWKKRVRQEYDGRVEAEEDGDRRLNREKTYGNKYWGKVRTIYREYKNKLRIFYKWG